MTPFESLCEVVSCNVTVNEALHVDNLVVGQPVFTQALSRSIPFHTERGGGHWLTAHASAISFHRFTKLIFPTALDYTAAPS